MTKKATKKKTTTKKKAVKKVVKKTKKKARKKRVPTAFDSVRISSLPAITQSKITKSMKHKSESYRFVLSSPVWENQYPCYLDVYTKGEEDLVEKLRYVDVKSQDFTALARDLIMEGCLPKFIKVQFKKIESMIKKELTQRQNLYQKATPEQLIAFESFFNDKKYFQWTTESEDFELELINVFIEFIRELCNNGAYTSKARTESRKLNKWLSENE